MRPQMKSTSLPIVLLSFLLIIMAGNLASGQQLAQNPGFETGDFTDWTLTGNSNSVSVSTNFLYAHSGAYGAELGPVGSLGYLSQNIVTVPGQSYCLSFWLDCPGGGATTEFLVSWNGVNIFGQTNLPAVGWTNLVFTNFATASNTTLQFGFRNDPSYFGLDDISVFVGNAASSSAAYTFTTLAGYPANGAADGVGKNAEFLGPFGAAVDGLGNVYVADTKNSTIRQITPAGVVTTLAGFAGFPGSADGIGSDARFSSPRGVALDQAGNIYVADSGNATIRKMTLSGTNWMVNTIAGQPGNDGSTDATGTNALFNVPEALALDKATNMYVVDYQENTLRKMTPVGSNWMVSTIAGLAGTYGSADGSNGAVRFSGPKGVAVDNNTNLYVSDSFNYTVRKITPSGTNWVATTLAGLAGTYGTNNGAETNAQFGEVSGIGLDSAGNLYVADSSIEANNGNQTIRKITPVGTNWVVSTFAGQALAYGSTDGTGTNARFNQPDGLAVDHAGTIYVADTANNEIRKITSAAVVTTLAGSAPGSSEGSADGTGDEARFNMPSGAAVDGYANIYIADTANNTIRQVTPAGSVSTVAGLAGSQGTNDGAGSNAKFDRPASLAVDNGGNIYVADSYNDTIRLITPAGLVSTIAGQPGNSGSVDGAGGAAQFDQPSAITVDGFGNVYVADTGNSTIRKIRPVGTNWLVTTIAGAAGHFGFANATNTNSAFSGPFGIAVDSAGNVYVADTFNDTLRKITPVGTNWVASTIVGQTGQGGSIDGSGASARLQSPYELAIDNAGVLYVADLFNSTLRRVTPSGTNWVVSTIGGVAGTTGSIDGAGSSALFNLPAGIAVDGAGNLFVADTDNNTVRQGVFAHFANIVDSALFSQPPANGQITVTLVPPAAGGQWRFPWEQAWRDSGTTAANLAVGEYPIEFSDVPGYLVIPLAGPVAVPTNAIIALTNIYYPTVNATNANIGVGSLTVNIGPSPPAGAGWNFPGNGTPFLPPGYTTNLVPDTYLIEFAPVGGYVTPPTLSVQIEAGQPTVLQVTYSLAQSPPNNVTLPVPVPPGDISDLNDYPFGFNGQLVTEVGYGSGVAVDTNVVLTAAHMVFNDQALSYVGQAYWFSQQEAGVFTPDPPLARGGFVLSGYAVQSTNDVTGGLGPDQSSPQSRNFDVATLYFLSPVANGGSGGYLSSDTIPNQWLSSTGNKLLVGYPVDGSEFGFTNIVNGRMYETGPQPYPLTLDTDPVADQQVYTASWFQSYPGNSGGPLYVQLNGYYYPAGVYLGTLFNGIVPYASAVRAIDSNVVTMINLAAGVFGTGVGTNYSGGGVITVIPSLNVSRNNPGYLILQLAPPSAVQAGAAWEVAGQPASYYSTANPSVQEFVNTNTLALQFKPIPGWNLPTNRSVTVVPGLIFTNVAVYTVTNPALTVDLVRGLGISGATNTSYAIQSNSALNGTWISFQTNTLTNFGFNLITNRPRPGYYRALWLTN